MTDFSGLAYNPESFQSFEEIEIFYGREKPVSITAKYFTIYDAFCKALINEITLSTYPLQIAKQEAGIETRRILNPVPSGATLVLEFPFLCCEEAEAIIALYDSRLGQAYPFLLPVDLPIFKHLPCGYLQHLPSNLWRFDGEIKFVREDNTSWWSISRAVIINLIGESF
jgi:hypothetical protein